MTHDLDLLMEWIKYCLILAAIFATAFPLLYAYAPWYTTRLGRALMLQGIAFALALDLTFIFNYVWTTAPVLVLFWTNAVVFTLIAVSTGWLTWKMLKHNVYIPLKKRRTQDGGQLRTPTRRSRSRRRNHGR